MANKESSVERENKPKGVRKPQQQRTQKRMQTVIATTERMLLTMGVETISIPEVAAASGVPRTSIYQFFPTKYDLLRHISLLHLNVLVSQLMHNASAISAEHNMTSSIEHTARHLLATMIHTAARFYNESAVASILILGGPFTRKSYLAHQVELKKISVSIRQALQSLNVDVLLPQKPDTLTILIELIFTCMKHGYYTDNHISDAMMAEAYKMSVAYLTVIKSKQFNFDDFLPHPQCCNHFINSQ